MMRIIIAVVVGFVIASIYNVVVFSSTILAYLIIFIVFAVFTYFLLRLTRWV